MQDNFTINYARAAHFSKPSTNYVETPQQIVAMINKAAPVEDKKNGPLIYFGEFPDKAAKRIKSQCEASTGYCFDYDGRSGDTVTRSEAEAAVRVAGIKAIFWNSFSSNGDGKTFRMILPASWGQPTDVYQSACRAVCEAIGLTPPQTILQVAQGFFFAPNATTGNKTDAVFIDGPRTADGLIDTFDLEIDPETDGDPNGTYADGELELTQEQFEDAVTVLDEMQKKDLHLSNGTGVWHRVAQSLCGYKEGTELFIAFSKGDKQFSERECKLKLAQKRKGHATTIAHLFAIAGEHGIENPGKGRHRASAFDDFAEELSEEDLPPMYCEQLTADQMTQRFCFIENGQQIIDRKNPTRIMSRPDFQAAYLPSWTPTPTPTDPTHQTSSTKLWMFNPGKMSLATITWRPGHKERTFDPEGKPAYNTFRMRKLPEFIFRQSHVDMFLQHITYLFGDRAEDFLNWFAHIEQRPGELPHTAWVNIATQTGIGRNWLTSLAMQIWPGEVAPNYDLVGQIDSNFNDALSKKRLIMVDEIRVAGSAGHKLEQRLKSIINEATRHINPKYGRKSIEYNCARWLMFSNHRSAIPIDTGDRRYEVVINDGHPETLGYYKSLYGALKDKTFALSVLTYLRQRDISAFDPGQRAKLTDSKMQVVESSRSVLHSAIADGLKDYAYPVITNELIRALSGLDSDTFIKNGAVVARIVEDCGWVKGGFVKRPGSGKKHVCHIRPDRYAEFKGNQGAGLPSQADYDVIIGIAEFGE